jgi:hypothetical protein
MNEHIQGTIAAIESRIAELQRMSQQLRELFRDDGQALPALMPIARNGTHRKPNSGRKPKAERTAVGPRPQRRFKVVDAIREVFRKSVGAMNAAAVRVEIRKAAPQLEDRLNSVSVNLLDMSNRGELHRTGAGSDATYRRAKLKEAREPISDTAAAYHKFRETIPAPATDS